MTRPLALVVDDEPDICELLELTLARMEIASQAAENLHQARDLLSKQCFDLCLTDMRLPDGSGIELVEFIQKHYPQIPVAVITAHGNMESAVKALKSGAYDFVSKPVDLHMLRNLVSGALRLSTARPAAAGHKHSKLRLIGHSDAMEHTRATIEKLARSQAPVHITGESGTGKELVARLIHEKGSRSDKPFVAVNCGAIPDHLMESEFFGHKKGSFTGALSDKAGLFQAADGGTLFFDEVADLPVHMQVKLLRAIQEKAIRPIGSQQEIPVDVRILSATHKKLTNLVKEGTFREDLFYRINVIEMRVPSLRERPEDISELARKILKRLAAQSGIAMPRLAQDTLDSLYNYSFPGNVRELENILERALTLSEEHGIRAEDLQLPVVDRPAERPEEPSLALEAHLGTIEKDRILNALQETHYNKTAAARLLGISFGALRYRLKKLGLD